MVVHSCWTIRGVDNPQVGKTTMNRPYHILMGLPSEMEGVSYYTSIDRLSCKQLTPHHAHIFFITGSVRYLNKTFAVPKDHYAF